VGLADPQTRTTRAPKFRELLQFGVQERRQRSAGERDVLLAIGLAHGHTRAGRQLE
jgi:hypothetical protein